MVWNEGRAACWSKVPPYDGWRIEESRSSTCMLEVFLPLVMSRVHGYIYAHVQLWAT